MPAATARQLPQSHRFHVQAAALAIAACVCWLLLGSTALAADFTWGGAGYPTTTWSDGANWLGGVAPSSGESIETLTLPKRTTGGGSHNDVSGLGLNHLEVGGSYEVTGEGVNLGSGGLSLTGSESISFLTSMPFDLSSNQTWTVSAPSSKLELSGALSGENSELTINLNKLAQLAFQDILKVMGGGNPDDEVGNVTINGTEEKKKLGESEIIYYNEVFLPSQFNATDGHRLTVNNLVLNSVGSTATGPITANHSTVGLGGTSIGPITAVGSGISLSGNVASLSLDEHSSLGFDIHAPGNSLAEDNQFSSGGSIDLGNSELRLESYQNEERRCPPPVVGQVHTLITTTGSLSGAFANVANGGTVVAECVATAEGPPIVERAYPFRITYNTGGSTKTVTATALPAVPTAYEEPEPPTISGTATQGQSLTESHGAWSNKPTSYSYQWQRCDSAGNNCQAISGAMGQTYTLTVADVGSTIRVQEIASNSEGESAPQVSVPTAVVQAAPAGGGGGGSTGGGSSTGSGTASGGGSTGSSGSTGSGSGSGTSDGGSTATISSAQIVALLTTQLVPSGKAAKIATLLKSGGVTMSFKALEAGTLTIGWYEVPPGAKLAKKTKVKPVLVASGQKSFAGAGTGTITVKLTTAGKRLLKHAKQLRLTAKGTFTAPGTASVSATHSLSITR
jgi:hypothetical protein